MAEAVLLERDKLVLRLRRDLIGPDQPDEVLSSRPSDVYLTGILWPAQQQDAEDDVSLDGGADDGESEAEEAAPQRIATKPSTAGVSFAFKGEAGVEAHVQLGVYIEGISEDGNLQVWKRQQIVATLPVLPVVGVSTYPVPEAPPGCMLSARIIRHQDFYLATVTLVNRISLPEKPERSQVEAATLFQVGLEVVPGKGSELHPRPSFSQPGEDEDERVNALLYRSLKEYATGHNCAAEWEVADALVKRISISWIPIAVVSAVSADGHEDFRDVVSMGPDGPLGAEWLSRVSQAELINGLSKFLGCYETWIKRQCRKIPDLPASCQQQAETNLRQCEVALDRMREGVELLRISSAARQSFQLANRAMALQRKWSYPDAPLQWRPFQMAFILLNCPSLLDSNHPDRNTMDLLWFPTGGGKTEAYLGLISILAFHRRLSKKDPDEGAGVAVIMRYTLRLLTTQQFERAAAVIFACELIRRDREKHAGGLGSIPFSVGLWVGGDATPNKFEDARQILVGGSDTGGSPVQLKKCPACRQGLEWEANESLERIEARCLTAGCSLNFGDQPLPIYTVDTDVYREKPTLVIGTVDKFAQVATGSKVRPLFALDGGEPPDLILQDELHLISGPLGTVTALYEVAVDRLCSRGSSRPKVIGSTATIRRAQEQIKALFDRDAFQFPPPGLDSGDSGFAVTDSGHPGRLYCGVTTAGRSPKFTLQAVTASLLQSATSLDPQRSDDYWTLLEYFNSLRELGGALVMMQDDVNDSVQMYASRHDEEARELDPPEELTSRRSQTEILEMLDTLATPRHRPGAVDMVLATNMISVGVDVQRLGLMVVNGQPKSMSEYIQATSRVGRKKDAPGLVVVVYNNSKVRDRSHYETFATWHQAIYREVEAISVTPFAPRSRDRALHAVLVALVRHLVEGMQDRPANITSVPSCEIDAIVNFIVERAKRVDSGEPGVMEELEERLKRWEALSRPEYMNRRKPNQSLMQDAERAAALRAAGRQTGEAWPVMNNMRSVEPSTELRLYLPKKRES
ncbi:MAG: helicase-related protein [Pseudomonadota bacterium]